VGGGSKGKSERDLQGKENLSGGNQPKLGEKKLLEFGTS